MVVEVVEVVVVLMMTWACGEPLFAGGGVFIVVSLCRKLDRLAPECPDIPESPEMLRSSPSTTWLAAA